MRNPKYVEAIDWIANEDNPGDEQSLEVVAGYMSVGLVADLFGVPSHVVARDVVDRRNGTGRVEIARQWMAFERRKASG